MSLRLLCFLQPTTTYQTNKTITNQANKSTTTGLLASYALSPRTNVYGLAGFTQNKGQATTTAIYGGAATDKDHTADSYAVGIKHSF